MNQPESLEQARAGQPRVSPELSIFWKPLRRLFEDGNPINPVTFLYYDLGDGKRLPFAAIAKTRRNRLILWPPWDAHEPCEFKHKDNLEIHHVTLELSNGKTHFTRFDSEGERFHEDRDWKLASFADGLKLWLIGAFSVSFLEKQVGVIEQIVSPPKTDSKRREDEFRRYAAQMKQVAINTPPLRGDCFLTVIHLLPEGVEFRGPIKPTHFPRGRFLDDWIDGWPDGDNFAVGCSPINVEGVRLLLLTASPLGSLRGECVLGSVKSQSSAK